MKFFYDTEFVEDGKTIELISIGIVADDGRELYLVDEEIGSGGPRYDRICASEWLMENVVPHLPLATDNGRKGCGRLSGNTNQYRGFFNLDMDDNRVVSRRYIRNAVRDFILTTRPIELWGYYSAYDHVVLSQLFGRMIHLPMGMPMWTNDVQQLAASLGLDDSLPPQTGSVHNALDDARWTKEAWEYLNSRHKDGAS